MNENNIMIVKKKENYRISAIGTNLFGERKMFFLGTVYYRERTQDYGFRMKWNVVSVGHVVLEQVTSFMKYLEEKNK